MLSKKIGFQMKTALVRVNYNSNYVVPPLGLGYMASYAQKFGHEVLIIDALRDNLPNDKVVEMINSADISAVGITCLSIFYEEVVDLSKKLKKNGKKVFIGGIHPTFNPKQTLIDSEADYVSIGEGEISFKKLLDANFDGEGIQGIYNLDNLPENPLKGERVENLDEKFDMITSRAVSSLKNICEYALPKLKKGGYFVAYKSRKTPQEIEEANSILKKYNSKIVDIIEYSLPLEENHERNLIVILKK